MMSNLTILGGRLCRLAGFVALLACTPLAPAAPATLAPSGLRCEYKENPVIDSVHPRLSWLLTADGRNRTQSAYQILVASTPEKLEAGTADLWDSGKVASAATIQIPYQGQPLTSRMEACWKVRVWDQDGNASEYSPAARWEMGLLDRGDWQAEWIGQDLTALGKGKVYHLPPAPFLRNDIQLKGAVKKARLYVSALGVYEFQINGQRIGNDWLTPGWTNYNKRVTYQTYDVTPQLKAGKNAIGAMLADGWYAGYLGYALLLNLKQVRGFYGDVPALMAQLEVEYADGGKEVFATDAQWKANYGPIVESDLLQGETYDARKEFDGWSKPGFDATAWKPVELFPKTDRVVEVHAGNPIRVIDTVKPISLTPRPDGIYIYDLGQNFAGVITLRVKGKAGDKVVIRYGEMLQTDGSLMTENLRMARATDTYILKGDPAGEEWTPRFTFHGFQFVELSGLSAPPQLGDITGLVLTSDAPRSGSFECSEPLLNKLYSNILWTQHSNYLDVPTDCPQRDERLGWTGDAQAYIASGILNNDVAAFFTKWIQDLNDDQWPSGAYPNFAPTPFIRNPKWQFSPGWMEAGIICPYNIFKAYGDTRLIERFWPNMEKFMAFHVERSGGKWFYPEASFEDIEPKGGFGDWLNVGKKTPPDMLATMYFGHCATLMAEMADGLGKADRAAYYRDVAQKVRDAFREHYIGPDGRFKLNAAAYGDHAGYVDADMEFSGNTQTAYSNALYMEFLNPELEKKAGEFLAERVKENDNKLTTGFLGAKTLLPALSMAGHSDIAYQLMLSQEYPSWLFEVVNGATTIWERWNSYTKAGGFVAGMNSFNHYAFGAVYEWMVGSMAGIRNGGVAYDRIVIRPEMNARMDHVKATYDSIRGTIASDWTVAGDQLTLTVEVPANTQATIHVPAASAASVTEGGQPVASVAGLKVKGYENGYQVIETGSGVYRFGSTIKR